ncbi:MAG: spherulation-specific family 4 protein [Acidimicrobiales bacterium]
MAKLSPRLRALLVLVVFLLAAGISVFLLWGGPPSGPAQLVPLYTDSAPQWVTACSEVSDTSHKSFIVANVQQGPGTAPAPAWEKIIDSCSRYGRAQVLGYVWTDYGRGGPGGVTSIDAQVRAWYTMYPGHVGGIFFDGVSDVVPGTGVSNQDFYRDLAGYVHRTRGMAAQVVFNFGANPVAGWMFDAASVLNANVIVTFEGSYNVAGQDPLTAWTPARWELRYPASDFAALVHSAPDTAALPQPATACHALREKHLGYLFVGTSYNELSAYFSAFVHSC